MSFDARDAQLDAEAVRCHSCVQEFHPHYAMQQCGHPGCKTKLCASCVILCGSCGQSVRCDEHTWRTTYNGALSKPIEVCDECRKEELDELAEAQEAHVE